MVQYFLANIDTFKAYCGSGILPLLFIACDIYILVTEKIVWKKMILGVVPLFIIVMFFMPFTRAVYEKVGMEDGTYYRVLWLVPMGVDVAYAFCRLFERRRKLGLVVATLVVVVLSGFNLVYRSQYITKAENRFHIPTAAIDICNLIAPKEGEARVRAACPPELVYFIRQYNTDIMLPYGRDYVEAQWDYWNAVYEQMNIEPGGSYNIEALLETTRQQKCTYVVLNMSVPTDIDPTTQGLVLLAQMDGYSIYMDPLVVEES